MSVVNPKYASQCLYRRELFLKITTVFKNKKVLVEEYYKCNLPKEEKCPRRVDVKFELFDVEGVCPDKKRE